MNFIEQLTEKSKLVIANTREERLDNIVKLCVAETAKEILCHVVDKHEHYAVVACNSLITQAEKTDA